MDQAAIDQATNGSCDSSEQRAEFQLTTKYSHLIFESNVALVAIPYGYL